MLFILLFLPLSVVAQKPHTCNRALVENDSKKVEVTYITELKLMLHQMKEVTAHQVYFEFDEPLRVVKSELTEESAFYGISKFRALRKKGYTARFKNIWYREAHVYTLTLTKGNDEVRLKIKLGNESEELKQFFKEINDHEYVINDISLKGYKRKE